MAVVNEQILTGRKFRKLIDETTKLWLRISFWTKACDVEFDDGETAETKFASMANNIDNIKKSFQDGVNKIFNFLKGLGFTPSPNSPDGICGAIQNMYNKRYSDGRTQGREDVKADPNAYGVSTSPQYAQIGRGTLTYTVPKAGTYNIIAGYEWHNNGGHNAVGTHITLDINGEIISLYELKTDSGAGPQNIKRTLSEGAVISLTAEDNYISEDTVAFAVGFLVVS